MFAVVTGFGVYSGGRKISVKKSECIGHIKVGARVGRRRLGRALRPYGGDFLFAPGIHPRGFVPFDTTDYRDALLFNAFSRYVASLPGTNLTVGVCDPDGRFLCKLTAIVNHVAQTVVYTHCDVEEFCEICLRETGICPEIAARPSWLGSCDVAFAPRGITGYGGCIFGHGGYTLCPDKLRLPDYCREAVSCGADPIDIAAMLSAEDAAYRPERIVPEYLLLGDKRVAVSELCAQHTKNAVFIL